MFLIKGRYMLMFFLLLFLQSATSQESARSQRLNERLKAFFAKDEVNILITDSGLGGLSVAAEIEKNFRLMHPFKKVGLIFVNALPSKDYLYNQMPDTKEKVRVFNNALNGMAERFKPDIILVACNTLSTLLNKTTFYQNTDIPVIGIVGFGVNLMYKNLVEQKNASLLILGTPTTIEQNSHKAALLDLGISGDRIYTKSCPMLESEIQNDPASDMVETMIEMYAEEALEKMTLPDSGDLFLGLCCTHYTYAAATFKKVFDKLTGKSVRLLDPNRVMSSFLFKDSENDRFDETDVTVRVVSQAELSPTDVSSIAKMIEPVSVPTAEALRNYHRAKSLFRY
ncbi:MAG: hypothetical protein GXO77_17400 [Calditrichaeota bacterium]|nr:hypothetical protein [Calditrichota bacterium]